jgi:hypothetical protein
MDYNHNKINQKNINIKKLQEFEKRKKHEEILKEVIKNAKLD